MLNKNVTVIYENYCSTLLVFMSTLVILPTLQVQVFKNWIIATRTRSSHWRCSVKMLFIKVPQNSLENTYVEVCNFLKKEALKQMFFSEFLRTLFFTENTSGRQLLVSRDVFIILLKPLTILAKLSIIDI